MANYLRFIILAFAVSFLSPTHSVYAQKLLDPDQAVKEHEEWIEKLQKHIKNIQSNIDESDGKRAELQRELIKVLNGMADQGEGMIRSIKRHDPQGYQHAQKTCNQLNEKRLKLSAQLDSPQKEGASLSSNDEKKEDFQKEDKVPSSIRTEHDLQRWLDEDSSASNVPGKER